MSLWQQDTFCLWHAFILTRGNLVTWSNCGLELVIKRSVSGPLRTTCSNYGLKCSSRVPFVQLCYLMYEAAQTNLH